VQHLTHKQYHCFRDQHLFEQLQLLPTTTSAVMISPFARRTRSDGTVTVSSFCCTTKCGIAASNKAFSVKRASRRQDRCRDREGLDGWMDGGDSLLCSLAPAASLLRVVRSFVRIEIWGEFAPTEHNNMQNVQKAKCPISLRSSPRFQLFTCPVLPCIARYYSYSSTTKLHHGWSFSHSV
jgi:hypothetical protein